MVNAVIVLVAGLAAICPSQTQKDVFIEFVDHRWGYAIAYPASWHVLDDSDFVNVLRGIFIPEGGADIWVSPKPREVQSLEDWIARDRLYLDEVFATRLISLTVRFPPKKRSITEVDGISDQLRFVDCYLELDGKIFDVHLTFWKTDPKVQNYKCVLNEMIGRLRALHATNSR